MRVVFMGTPDFSVPALDAIAQEHEVICVYSQPPRPAGRGKKLRPSPVHARADALGIETRTPLNFKDPEDVAAFTALKADIAVVVAYGLLLPQSILDAPKLGCVNIHASLLPRWRGAAPIHRAIMAGDSETGICIMQMEAGLDTGPVLLREAMPVAPDDTTGSLHDKLAQMGGRMIASALAGFDGLLAQPQSEQGVTYAKKIDKAESKIDWGQSAAQVDAHIRGLSPFPGAWFEQDGERIKVLRSALSIGEGAAGTIRRDPLRVCCKSGAVSLLTLQRAGKGAMEAEDFLRGFDLPDGCKLGS